MHIFHRFGHMIGGTLLVAGTTVGVGMLALPVATGQGGYIPALLIYFICWLFMLCTGLLILEACTWSPKEANLLTMAQSLLGRGGKVFCWIVYLFLFTCLMVAHVASGGNVMNELSGGAIPNGIGIVLYVLLFSPVVFLGTKWVDRFNILLMVGLVLSYAIFITQALPHIQGKLLLHFDMKGAWSALPVVFTAFGYQSLIPTLYNYMGRDLSKVRRAIFMGTSIPLTLYVVWELLILGIVPPDQLAQALKLGQNSVQPLGNYLQSPGILKVGAFFALFAMTTSFVGIAIAFVDFLADGLKMQKNKTIPCLLIFGVPTLIVLTYPGIFIQALTYAGGFGVALLLGVMPIAMVWAGRYFRGHSLLHQQIPGGKISLSFLLLFALVEIAFQFV